MGAMMREDGFSSREEQHWCLSSGPLDAVVQA